MFIFQKQHEVEHNFTKPKYPSQANGFAEAFGEFGQYGLGGEVEAYEEGESLLDGIQGNTVKVIRRQL